MKSQHKEQRAMANPNINHRNKTTLNPANGSLAPARRSDTDTDVRRAGALILKARNLGGQSPLELEALKATAAIWADELIKAGIPPRLWDEMFTLARKARPVSSKGFMVTADQVIDTWEHYLRGHRWIFEEKIEERYGEQYTRRVGRTCYCVIAQRARNSYRFRRFSAAYEIRWGSRYKPSKSDLISLYESRVGDLLWDDMVDEYCSDAEPPTLKGLYEYLRAVGGER